MNSVARSTERGIVCLKQSTVLNKAWPTIFTLQKVACCWQHLCCCPYLALTRQANHITDFIMQKGVVHVSAHPLGPEAPLAIDPHIYPLQFPQVVLQAVMGGICN